MPTHAIPDGGTVDAASDEAVKRLDSALASIARITRAGDVLPILDNDTLLHPGPPLREPPKGPLLAGLAGALRVTRPELSRRQAREWVARGNVRLLSAHEHNAVLPAAGGLSRDMAVVSVVSDRGHQAACPLNEGTGRTLRFGYDDEPTIARLCWMADVVAPALDEPLRTHELTALLAASLRRGDEGHGRTIAGRDLLLLAAARRAARSPAAGWPDALEWAATNHHFFNSFAVAAARVLAMSAAGVPGSRLVTAIASNGQELGIRVEGTSSYWLTAPSPAPAGGPAHPLIGDSFAMEVVGLGAAALDAAPASLDYFGCSQGDVYDVVSHTAAISRGTSTRWLVPQRGFAGTSLGLDPRLIVDSGRGPAVDHAVLSASLDGGQLGAALTYLPITPFTARPNEEQS